MSAVLPSKSKSNSTSISIAVGTGEANGASTALTAHFHSNSSASEGTGVLVVNESSSNSDNVVSDISNNVTNAASMDKNLMTSSTYYNGHSHSGDAGLISEITEIIKEDGRDVISDQGQGGPDTGATSLFSIDINNVGNVVYVAVGESQTSMDALLWTLNHAVQPPNSLVCLVHVFPPLKFIPSPMGAGKVPMSQVSRELAESYVAQQRSEIRQVVGKYTQKCTSYQVPADTMLIESDSVANAILELISILNIPKLVVGISKSKLRKLTGEKGSGIVAHEILQNAPVGCEIKVVCEGKDVLDQGSASPFPKSKSIPASPKAASGPTTTTTAAGAQDDEQKPQHSANGNSFSCCFKPNF